MIDDVCIHVHNVPTSNYAYCSYSQNLVIQANNYIHDDDTFRNRMVTKAVY